MEGVTMDEMDYEVKAPSMILKECIPDAALRVFKIWIHDSIETCHFCDHRVFECEIKAERMRRILKAMIE
jgi:hypothetical protein